MKVVLKVCPKCKKEKNMTYPALSRKDNKTEICSQCGIKEAVDDFYKIKGIASN